MYTNLIILNSFYNVVKKFFFENKLLLKNFSNLSFLQLFSIILPLLTYPYLIRVLGKDIFGLVVFAQSFMQYFIMFINYGFNISTTQTIALNKDDVKLKSEIISSTLILKGMLFGISILIILFLIFIIPALKNHYLLFICSITLCIQEVLFPTWYFLGMEEMKYITRINILSRSIFTVLIFVLVKDSSDFLLVPLINAIGGFVAGTYSLYILFYKKKYKFSISPFASLIHMLKNSTYYFLSNMSSIIYSNTGNIILGFNSDMGQVAFYDLGQKVLGLFKTFISIIEQTIFPNLTKTKNLFFFRKIFKITILTVVVLIIIPMFFSDNIITIIGGVEMLLAKDSFRIILLSAIPIVVSTFYGHILLLVWNKKESFLKLKVFSLISYLTLLFFTNTFYELNALSLSILFFINELFISLVSYVYSNRVISKSVI